MTQYFNIELLLASSFFLLVVHNKIYKVFSKVSPNKISNLKYVFSSFSSSALIGRWISRHRLLVNNFSSSSVV